MGAGDGRSSSSPFGGLRHFRRIMKTVGLALAAVCALFAGADEDVVAGRFRGFRERHFEERLGAKRRAGDAGAAFAGTVRYVIGLSVGAGAGFEGQSVRGRRHGSQAVPHFAGRQRQTAGGSGWAGDPRHCGGFQRPGVRGHVAGRQNLSRDGQRETGGVLRSQGRNTSGRCCSIARTTSLWPRATRARFIV